MKAKKKKFALVVIDMLEDFVYGALANVRAARIIPNIQALLEKARADENWIVVFANDAHLPGDFEEAVWGAHALAGSKGAEVIAEFAPQAGDFILPKRFYSAFYETGLDSILKQNDVEAVVLVGQHTHICVRHSAADALYRGYKIIVPEDGVESFSDKDQQDGLEYLKMAYKAEIVQAKDLL